MHPQFELLERKFKLEVHDRSNAIDHSNEQDWFSLTLGWAIGKGLSPDEANDFAFHIRYHTKLG
jgi:hypothetical protein